MKRPLSLTEEQFAYIVKECDAILDQHRDNFSVLGIAWLNVLHSHPSIQERYVRVFHKRTFIELVRDVVKGAGVIFVDLLYSFASLFRGKAEWKKIDPGANVLFISHLLNASTPKNAPDFYFQELPAHLHAKGYRVAVGLMNHVNGFEGWKTEPFTESHPQKILLPLRLDFGAELKLLCRSLRTSWFFARQYLEEREPLRKSFLRELMGNVLSAHSLRAFRLYEIARYHIAHSDVRTIAFTWEGHSWERMACHAAKTAPREVKAIGYQHTILFPSSHMIKKSLGEAYDPSVVLTVGDITRKILFAADEWPNVIFKTYGSPRLTKAPSYTAIGELRNACLVTPEGLANECIALFSFAIQAAEEMPGTDFIFRTHPMISFNDLQEEEPALRNLPPNVILSSYKSMDDDFKRSSWLLYRNSSVSFFAILAGLRPLYLQIGNEISNDVLYALNSWRKNIVTINDLKAIVRSDRQTTAQQRNTEREEAFTFAQQYMLPYRMDIFEESMNERTDG